MAIKRFFAGLAIALVVLIVLPIALLFIFFSLPLSVFSPLSAMDWR